MALLLVTDRMGGSILWEKYKIQFHYKKYQGDTYSLCVELK
jgi:hypothetical protein